MTVTAPAPVPASGPAPAADRRTPHERGGGFPRSFALLAAEAATAFGTALLLFVLCMRIRINPLDRIGQVSGLAGVQLRLLVVLAAVLLGYFLLARVRPGAAVRLGAAAVAGLSSGVTASGIVMALRGTIWPISANTGDLGNLQQWAYNVIDGGSMPPEYPPGFPHVLAWTAELFFDGHVQEASKWVMLGFLAIGGPVAYLAWRMLLSPLWALGIGVTASLPLIDPVKPYSALVLVVVIPVFAKLVQVVQEASNRGRKISALIGAGLGALLAALFLLYSGWFVWSSIGVVVLFAIVLVGLARRSGMRGLLDGLLPLASAVVVFLALAGTYMIRLLGASGATKDSYFYFDTYSDPAYFTMWGSSLPGPLRTVGYSDPAELGGVGLFTLVLIAGLGLAFALGLRRPLVLTLAACTGSAFFLRYWYASHMARDQAVQLYPRTSQQIMYCLLALTGVAVLLLSDRVREWVRAGGLKLPGRVTAVKPRAAVIGVLCALGLLFATAGSATAYTYMPKNPSDNSLGVLAWFSHNVQQPNGACPHYADKHVCTPYEPPKRSKKH
ncbi:hypothetical protein ACIGFK_40160 [Streptomyces sp. NPDC085524]|uniref:hypothetical protein n=1 Tax=unclassified Streptomyces TaxID=2593676 RepID=UPI0036996E34